MWLVGLSKETKIFVGMLARGLGLLLQLKPWEIKRWIHGPTVDAVRSHLNVNVIFHAAAVVFRYVLSGSYGHSSLNSPIEVTANIRGLTSRRVPARRSEAWSLEQSFVQAPFTMAIPNSPWYGFRPTTGLSWVYTTLNRNLWQVTAKVAFASLVVSDDHVIQGWDLEPVLLGHRPCLRRPRFTSVFDLGKPRVGHVAHKDGVFDVRSQFGATIRAECDRLHPSALLIKNARGFSGPTSGPPGRAKNRRQGDVRIKGAGRRSPGFETLAPGDHRSDRSLGPWPGTGPRHQTRHILDLRALRADRSRLGQCPQPGTTGGVMGWRHERISWCARSQGIHIRPLVNGRLRHLEMAPHLIQCRGQRHFWLSSP